MALIIITTFQQATLKGRRKTGKEKERKERASLYFAKEWERCLMIS